MGRIRAVVHAVSGRAGVRMRTTTVAVAVLVLALATTGVVVVTLLERSLDGEITDSARSTAQQVVNQVYTEGARNLSTTDVASTGDAAAVIQVVDRRGAVLASDGSLGNRPALVAARPVPGVEAVETVVVEEQEYRVVSRGVRGPDGLYTVISARSLEPVSAASQQVALLLTLAAVPLLLICGVAVHRAIGSALYPVERMRRTVADISTRDMQARVGMPPGRDEVHRLAETLNTMLDRLTSAQAAQRRFVADASHELRSPLSTIGAAIDVATQHPETTDPEELVAVVSRETARLAELVDDLLMLARTDDATDRPGRGEVDLDDLVRAEAERVSGGTVEVSVRAHPAKVRGSQAQLRRAVRNLVDNARDHARGRVALSSSAEDATAVVEVCDDGPGVPEGERARIFERFVRLDSARRRGPGATGLGLAIVAGIAARHGGRAGCFAGSGDYPGARFRLELPIDEDLR